MEGILDYGRIVYMITMPLHIVWVVFSCLSQSDCPSVCLLDFDARPDPPEKES